MILRDKIAAGHRGGDFSDVAHLAGQVAGHGVDGVGEVLPGSGYTGDLCLTAELTVGAYFARHAGYFRRKYSELLDHGVDDFGRAKKVAFERTSIHVHSYRLRQISFGHGRDGAGNFGGRPQEILDQGVDRILDLPPGATGFVEPGPLTSSASFAHHLTDAPEFLGDPLIRHRNFIERVSHFSAEPGPGTRKAHGKITVTHGLHALQDEH